MTKGTAEIAQLFAVEADPGANFAAELYPGYPGLVVADGRARAMNWGFPLVLTGKQGQKLKPKPVTNAREDRLLTGFWRESFVQRRCLVPVSRWAEPLGDTGRMTRSWYALPDAEVFAVAGLWQPGATWGDSYAMVLVDGSQHMAGAHDRMPVILRSEDWRRWCEGTPDEALALCRTWDGPVIAEHTAERWAGGGTVPIQQALI